MIHVTIMNHQQQMFANWCINISTVIVFKLKVNSLVAKFICFLHIALFIICSLEYSRQVFTLTKRSKDAHTTNHVLK